MTKTRYARVGADDHDEALIRLRDKGYGAVIKE